MEEFITIAEFFSDAEQIFLHFERSMRRNKMLWMERANKFFEIVSCCMTRDVNVSENSDFFSF